MVKNLLKNYLMAIVAVVMIVGFSAFKVVERNNKVDLPPDFISWYFIGDDSETHMSNKYTETSSGVTCGVLDEVVCEIKAPRKAAPFQNEPDLNALIDPNEPENVSYYIDEAMNNLGSNNIIVQSFRINL